MDSRGRRCSACATKKYFFYQVPFDRYGETFGTFFNNASSIRCPRRSTVPTVFLHFEMIEIVDGVDGAIVSRRPFTISVISELSFSGCRFDFAVFGHQFVRLKTSLRRPLHSVVDSTCRSYRLRNVFRRRDEKSF